MSIRKRSCWKPSDDADIVATLEPVFENILTKFLFEKFVYSDDYKKDLDTEKLKDLSAIFIRQAISIDPRGGIFAQSDCAKTVQALAERKHFTALIYSRRKLNGRVVG